MYTDRHPKILAFIQAAHQCARSNLLQCSSGNLSLRLDDNLAALSASRSWLGELTPEQVCLCDIPTGRCLNDRTPTVESAFHLGILRARPDVNCVLHFQSPYATALACTEHPEQIDFNILPEIPYYIGAPAVVEFLLPGSTELAQATIDAMKNAHLAILKNHGLVTAGRDTREALQRAAFFELACKTLLTAPHPACLNPSAVKTLKQSSKI